MEPARDIQRLIDIMAALRTPGTGCPWDLEQSFETIAPYTIEEAYEVADAIERRDLADLKEELGDLLLQVVYHARMAEEAGVFSFGDIVEGVTRKMIRRHPHVFGDETARSAGAVNGIWDRIKAEERAQKAAERARMAVPPSSTPDPTEDKAKTSLLADIPMTLPGLTRAIKLQDKAAKVGFDWPGLIPVFDKMKEELAEFEEVAIPLDPRGALAASRQAAAQQAGSPEASANVVPLGTLGKVLQFKNWNSPPPGGPHRGEGEVSSEASGQISASPAPSGRLDEGESEGAIKEEFGDLLFVLANVARHLKIDPEACLRGANQKFVRRFTHIETRLAERGKTPAQSSLEEMDQLWDEAKFFENLDKEA
jgi:ATP diphosphatase